jgi:guanylate kinase
MDKEHTLLIVMGRSGAGKDSLVDKVCEKANLKKLISYTTRPQRDDEGDTHIFVSEEDYEQMLADGQVAAYTEINGNKYWSTINQMLEADVYICDYTGLKILRELKIPGLRLVIVYIKADAKTREYRAINLRKDNKITFRQRCLSENNQFRELVKNEDFDYAITNNNFATAFSVLKWIVMAEGIWKNTQEGV